MRKPVLGLVVAGSVAVASPAAKPQPQLTLGATVVARGYDATTFAATLEKSSVPLLACFQAELANNPHMVSSMVKVTWTIGADGMASHFVIANFPRDYAACIVKVVSSVKFAKPKDGVPVDATQILTFDSGADSVPGLSLGKPTVTGELDSAIVRRYLKRNIQSLSSCYEKQLSVNPQLAGVLQAEFAIDAAGLVTTSKASGVDPDVAACVANVIKKIEFPKPKTGTVAVSYPITCRPPRPPTSTPDAKK